MDMDNPPKSTVNLKHLPPIDPFRIMSSKGELNNSSTRHAATVVKPSPYEELNVVDSDEGIKKIPTLGNVVVDEASSISSEKRGETQIQSAHEGMKRGFARSNLYEICAANHWKPPIFECYKEEGPSHQRMFTFKVIIEIEEALKSIIECYGAPHRQKKTAADHAAEGALWCLKHIGYAMKNQ